MPGFDTLTESIVALADRLTASLQVPIVIEPFVSLDVHLVPTYGAAMQPIPKGTVDAKTQTVKARNGDVIVASAKVTFPRNVTIHTKDRVTLPDGTVGIVVAISQTVKPSGGGYITVIWIGNQT